MRGDDDMRAWSLSAQMQLASTFMLSTVFSNQHSDHVPLCVVACSLQIARSLRFHMHHVRMHCSFEQTNESTALLSTSKSSQYQAVTYHSILRQTEQCSSAKMAAAAESEPELQG
jgi:hypothetical protein